MTAVKWLEKELELYGDPGYCTIEWKQLDSLIKQTKEMEKQQLIDAADWNVTEWQLHDGKHYYNEIFKSE